ncbi:MAG: hypothetical protein L6R35_005937 [Caloplaca aegaea]|nr:MAG: hypothetical protein L6R35_005937 [Caloplaca aegaea]
MDAEEFRRAAYSAVDDIVDYFSALDSRRILPNSPNFMALFPANVTYPFILGELYSAAFTAPAFDWLCSPACTELEIIFLNWLCNALNLPSSYLSTLSTGGGGAVQGSASEAVVTVMIAAMERCIREHMGSLDKNGRSHSESEAEKEWQLTVQIGSTRK